MRQQAVDLSAFFTDEGGSLGTNWAVNSRRNSGPHAPSATPAELTPPLAFGIFLGRAVAAGGGRWIGAEAGAFDKVAAGPTDAR